MRGLARFVFVAVLAICTLEGSSKNIHSRIVGGNVARAGEFPFNAAITYKTADGTYFCGGVLIGNQWVLTAAHCVADSIMYTIRFGSNHLTTADPNRITVATEEAVVHPDYDPMTYANNLGLIKLRLPITFNEYIRSINLPNLHVAAGSAVVGIGWGQTSDDSAMVEELHDVNLIILSDDECKLSYGGQIKDNMVCVAGNNDEGTCNGDSGGPLIQYQSRGQTFVVGVSIFQSQNGCETAEPSGYVMTYPYVEWIRNVTNIF